MKKSKKVKDGVATEGVVNYSYNYPMRILMTAPKPSTKTTYKVTYNPNPKMKTLMMTLAKIDHGLAVMSIDGKSTLIIKDDTFPKSKEQFKKFFTYNSEPNGTKVCLGCNVNRNQTLNHLKHAIKPNCPIQWLCQERVFLEADQLGIGKTKTIRYLTNIHPCIVNCTSPKDKIYNMLNTTIINPEEATKLDSMLQDLVNAMQESGDDATVHCPVFELFQTTIGIGNNPHIETDILGIKCQVSKATLLREFVLQTSQTLEQQGKGKFIPAGLANVIGTETMTSIICSNNQYLKSITTVPINGLPADALKIKITITDDTPEKDKVPITVHDYLLNTEWCHGLESTEHEGRYLLITTHSQIAEAREWLDENLESLFVDYLPNYGNFTPIEGHAFPT